MALAAMAALQAAEGVYEIADGIIGSAKDKKEAEMLKKTRPKASANPEIRANQALAASELSNPDAAANQALEDGVDTALATSLGAMLKGGGTPNDVASVFANNEGGRQRMTAFREQLRQQKIQQLSNAYLTTAQDQKDVFDYNNRQWFDEAQANAMKTAADKQLTNAGIGSLVGAGANYLGAKNQESVNTKTLASQKQMYDDLDANHMARMNQYFNPPKPIVTDWEETADPYADPSGMVGIGFDGQPGIQPNLSRGTYKMGPFQ